MSENIERIFQDEVREKRRTGSGVFSRRGKGVKHTMNAALRTPYHFMKQKERKKLNGEVVVSYMYETIISKEEFLLKTTDIQKAMLTRWREIYDNETIKAQMGITNKAFYDLVGELKIPKKERTPRTGGVKKELKAVSVVAKPKKEDLPEEVSLKSVIITRGLHLEYNGEYGAEDLNKIFTKLQILTDGEESKFNLSISLTERT